MNDNPKEELSLKEVVFKVRKWISYLKSQWIKILVIGIIGGAVGLSNAYFKKPTYLAIVRFTIESEQGGGAMSGALGLASKFGIDVGGGGGGAFTGNNLIELMKSRMLIQKVLLRPVTLSSGKLTTLAEMYIDIYEWRTKWEKKPEFVNLHFKPGSEKKQLTLEENSVIGSIYTALLSNDLKIAQKDPQTSIINIEATSANEEFSKFLVEIISEELSSFYIDTKTHKSATNVAILQRQVDSIRIQLNSSLSDVASSNDNTFNLNSAMNFKKLPSTKRQIDVQGNSAIYSELLKNLEIAKMTLRNETPLLQMIDKPVLPLSPITIDPKKAFLVGFVLALFLSIAFLIIKKWLSAVL